ncbi:hypothetical protein [Paraclostridium sordellii]|uniref:hypothetical protein n=1 Tax=Paraclostridium sordellii TaxID=1505 RepID=UPI000C764A1E|nr:hypothetical protein [Paeniclostridium sordellii]AUN13446.1 hypothetical protein RSJ16_04100 [Paeniclostridium sordellii]
MGDNKLDYTEKNFNVYTDMIKYIRNLNMLEIHKRQINQKLYNMYVNLSSKGIDLENYVVNPKEFCDKLCSNYVKNTSLYVVYLETIKKFSLVVAILALGCDLILERPIVSKYFVYILLGAFLISLLLTYLKMYRAKKYGIGEEPIKYKILYNLTAVILVVPIFLLKNYIKVNASISIIFIGIVSIIIFFISSYIVKVNKKILDKKISCKSVE